MSLVPKQRIGKAIDAESSVVLSNEKTAVVFFEIVKNRLQHVNSWAALAGGLSAKFQLVNKEGIEVSRKVQEGDYLRIDIPGPGTRRGNGFDWVRIEVIESKSSTDSELFGFRVRPTENPQSNKGGIAHFYSDESTSTFMVSRLGNRITAMIHDRNTQPNSDEDTTTDKIRDVVVGAAGIMSFSEIQWKHLTDGLVSK